MTKAIVSYPKDQQGKVVARRLASVTGGLGYLAAQDAQKSATRNELISKGLIKPEEKASA